MTRERPTRAPTLHSLVRMAAKGELPPWAVAGEARQRHMASVARVMEEWAVRMGLDREQRIRWRAVAFLHDALRDEDPERLRPVVPAGLRGLPARVLHGPAAAERLRIEGVGDEGLLRAVSFHTLGHPELDRMGRFLFAADYLEPERVYTSEETEELRERMPDDPWSVLREVARARLRRTLDRAHPLDPRTAAFWNRILSEAGGQEEADGTIG